MANLEGDGHAEDLVHLHPRGSTPSLLKPGKNLVKRRSMFIGRDQKMS